MVSKDQKKIERVINFMKKGLTSLADDLEETVKGINDFIKSLAKAQKDLKEVSVVEEVQTVSTSSKILAAPRAGDAKTAAATTLFSLLSSGSPVSTPTAAPTINIPTAPAPPSGRGPPSAPKPPVAGPPSSGGPPKKPTLPPAPKLPPAGGGPPSAPPSGGSPIAPSGVPPAAPTFAKRPGPPVAGPPSAPSAPSAPSGPTVAPRAGGGLSSLRDEMLDELNRLKKIMRGE
ncbi:MAG: hypothetical protein ACFFDF_05385 [Candidatus Odinarchaeota archaeon]